MNFLMLLPATLDVQPKDTGMNSQTWYILGAVIAFCLLGYLVYSLVKPEKF